MKFPTDTSVAQSPVGRLKAWLAATFPDEIHVAWDSIGYYAAGNYNGPGSDEWGNRDVHAQLRYYAGYGSGKTGLVEQKLEAAAPLLDALDVKYAPYRDRYGYAYLCVDAYLLPLPEEDLG